MTTETQFKPILIGFDESGYNAQKAEIEDFAEFLNIESRLLLEDYDQTMTNEQLQTVFLNNNPDEYLQGLFPEIKSKKLRAEAIAEFKAELGQIISSIDRGGNKGNIQYLTVKNGKFDPNSKKLGEIKTRYERYIENEKQKRIFDLHNQAFQAVKEIEELTPGQTFLWQRLFFQDIKGDLQKTDLKYNLL